ncbi:BQ5605_C006g03936 [Microbotryum silenes-dioicae]|uniref:Ubiquitin carboxyl-terminal hydrolase n=1 Tax=Microbotryum silenes-dioicae TaxID=796604 RepID=A0A2X0M5G6_9BASI|nr:BQ5605_C006g03936 [Microbotryum silenes-dioicae]
MASEERQRWLPLESNPESFNTWSHSLGLDTSQYSFQDCYGLDAEVLGWVKQPVKVEWTPHSINSTDSELTTGRFDPQAAILLFPITEAYEKVRREEDARIEEDGVEQVADIIYFKQTIANACGTFGLLHALANAGVPLEPGYLTKLFEQCKDKTPDLDTRVNLHFCTFVEHKGNLIELDGRRNLPINLGKISKDLLQDTAVRVKKIIELSNSLEFNLITLNPTPED